MWTPLDWNYLRSYEVATIVVVAEEAKYKDKGIEDISEGIKDGTISFKESAKEQDETSYE